MTHQGVHVGFGTLYTLLEQFLETEMIRETKVEGRRRSYILNDKGREIKIYLFFALAALLAGVSAACSLQITGRSGKFVV